MLNSQWALHDVHDVEAAVQNIIGDYLRQRRAYLREHDREDLAQFLLGVAWDLSQTYDKSRGWSFSKVLYSFGSLRITDWYRTTWQDLRSPKPELALSLNGPATSTNGSADGLGPSLIETLATQAGPGDVADHVCGDMAFRELFGGRGSAHAPPDPHMGASTNGRARHTARAA